MRKKIAFARVIYILILLICLPGFSSSQNLTKTNFISVLTPQFMGSVTSTRIPVVFRATVTGLTANTTYRYFNQAAISSDIGGSNPGAGNPMLINSSSASFRYSSGPSISSVYETFTTNASGSFTGWFAFVHTGNARFTAGNYVIPTIVIGSTGGTTLFRYALNDSIKVLAFSTSAGANNGTGIYGTTTLATPRNMMALYDNTSGTGKPLALTYIENTSNTGEAFTNTPAYYTDSVIGKNGRWGTIIPNNNSNGVRRIEQLSISGAGIISSDTDPDGIWLSANTVNPAGGSGTSTTLRLDVNSAPSPVEISYFSHSTIKNSVKLSWQTVWEINNSGFRIERADGSYQGQWKEIGFINGNGTTNTQVNYEFTDRSLLTGKYNYRIRQVDYNGNFEYFALAETVNIGRPVTSEAYQNFPNPFNPVTDISFSLSDESYVQLYIYNIAGQIVQKLIDGNVSAGYNSISFDGSSLASGVYFYRISASNSSGNVVLSKIKKMLLVK